MLHLTKNMIKNIAANDNAYLRGVQYFQNGRIQNASYSKTSGRYKITVRGTYSYTVIVEEGEDSMFGFSCNCPATSSERGACKHVVAALLMLLKYQERGKGTSPKSPEEKRAYQVLEYFDNQEIVSMTGEVFHIEPIITLPSILRKDSGKAYVSLRVGSTRLYKLQNLKKFLEDYIRQENIILGKEFRYIVGESELERSSKRLLDFLLALYDLGEQFEKKDSTALFHKSQMILSKFLFLRFLHQIEDIPFTLELYGKTYEEVRCIPKNPIIEIDMASEEDSLTLDYKDKEPIIPVSENGEILYRDGFLYLPDKQFLCNFLPFFNNLGEERAPLVFQGSYKQRFLESVLPKLHGMMDINVPEELRERYISPDLKAEIFFDKYQNYVKAELIFVYQEYRFNSFESPKSGKYIILRQREKEQTFIQNLEKYKFEPYSGFYLLKADQDIYQFIEEGIPALMEEAELFYSESFRKMKARNSHKFSVGLRLSEHLDLLELDLNYGDISKEELRQMFRAYRLKRKFFRLLDGSFIDLESEDIRQMVGKLDNLNVSGKTLETGQTFQVSKGLALYLDDLFDESKVEVQRNEEFQKLTNTILSIGEQTYEVPNGIHATLRPYQITGYQWLMTLAENQLGGILADDMGLGKTLQSIVYIKAMKDRFPDALFFIVCPTSLVFNWLDEFENFAPELRCRIISGTPEERAESLRDTDHTDVLISSYPLLRRDIASYEEKQFHTVFLDEAQFIKNAASLNAKSVKSLHAEHRFALTGTPMENSLSELWSIFDFVMPYYLLSHTNFVRQYEKQILKKDEEALEGLNKRIRPFILRRMKKDVLLELPEKIENKFMTELTEEQKKLYLSFLENFRGELAEGFSDTGAAIDHFRFQILSALTRLRQICCHPSTFLDNYDGGSGKLELFLQLLPDLVENGHRILVFSQFTSMLEIICRALDDLGYEYFYLEGSTKTGDRSDYVKRFNAGERQLFLISLKAGGTGLNLVGADTVIHFDPWWNPAVEEQATDRAHRIGQTNSVHVIKLITKGTIEEKIYKLQRKKKELSESVIEAKEVFISSLSKKELEELFSFDG